MPAETIEVEGVEVGTMLYAPEAYPASLWGRVTAVMPDPERKGYVRIDMDGVPPAFGVHRHVHIKLGGVVRVKPAP